MIIIGSEFVEFSPVKISEFSKENLKNTEFILVKNKIQAIFANANLVKFIVCEDLNLARQLQEIANDYIFDSKIALIINDDDELNKAIEARIDAVLYENAIIK